MECSNGPPTVAACVGNAVPMRKRMFNVETLNVVVGKGQQQQQYSTPPVP